MNRMEYLKTKERLIEFFKEQQREKDPYSRWFWFYPGINVDAAISCGCGSTPAFNDLFNLIKKLYIAGWRFDCM